MNDVWDDFVDQESRIVCEENDESWKRIVGDVNWRIYNPCWSVQIVHIWNIDVPPVVWWLLSSEV